MEKRPPLKVPEKLIQFEVADKTRMQVVGIANLTFIVSGRTFTWDTYIAPISDDGLLGMDFLFAHDFSLNIGGLQLDGHFMDTEVEGIRPSLCKVALSKDSIIPARSECVLDGTSIGDLPDIDVSYLVEPSTEKSLHDNLLVGSTLVSAHQRKHLDIPVRIMNVSAEES